MSAPASGGGAGDEAPTQHLPPVNPAAGANPPAAQPPSAAGSPVPGPPTSGAPTTGAPTTGAPPYGGASGGTYGGAGGAYAGTGHSGDSGTQGGNPYSAGAGGTYGGGVPGGTYGGAAGAHGADSPYAGDGTYGGQGGAGGHGGHGGSGPYGGGGDSGDYWGAPVPPPQRKKGRGGLVAAVLAAALLAGGIGGGVGYWAADRSSGSSPDTVSAPGNAGDRAADSVAGIASKALPSVVTIQLNGGTGTQGGGTGTGFVFDKQGHIMTNNHVVAAGDGDAELTVVFSDGEKYEAEVVGRAEGYDVAVIKLRNPGDAKLTPLPLGKSGDVAVGDATVAIGAPFGLSGTVTTGIVSALKRPVASSDGEGSAASYMSALQTDASINPGNSGGPLLNDSGAVIGVNSAIQSTGDGMGGSAGSIGLGFAIPIDQAKRVAQNLIETGEPVYPIIGATVDMRGQGKGAEVIEEAEDGSDSVISGGPADKAGLRGGDVITKLGNTQIDSGPTLISEIWTYKPGNKVKLTYERNGNENTTTITLGKRTGD
ncbi:trypsin-like peptidase domain-containing protein [Streptomyces sp. XM4193]|uniref:S1C family serine protease n=1 Tax=Streptomyces sp. XM4193 TaxID=2929782 RepID=UPI001FFA5177|nr:trypsin-like peptidase domain-containing protein [Streptomyces sp. XM4193]MCK1794724.1 trypsin-like peptidase domain-containing protein [Streptomyces sp. XM4193]